MWKYVLTKIIYLFVYIYNYNKVGCKWCPIRLFWHMLFEFNKLLMLKSHRVHGFHKRQYRERGGCTLTRFPSWWRYRWWCNMLSSIISYISFACIVFEILMILLTHIDSEIKYSWKMWLLAMCLCIVVCLTYRTSWQVAPEGLYNGTRANTCQQVIGSLVTVQDDSEVLVDLHIWAEVSFHFSQLTCHQCNLHLFFLLFVAYWALSLVNRDCISFVWYL